jgi:hypothetical protein
LSYDGPSQAVESVLRKLDIDPCERLSDLDQDPEYTACRCDELEKYLNLYRSGAVSSDERDGLACFMLEGLNEFASQGIAHPLERLVFETLVEAGDHSDELAYWMDTTDPDDTNWWPITQSLLRFHAARKADAGNSTC